MCNKRFNCKNFSNNNLTNDIFQAINGPLQQRTSILDLDLSRANEFPQDYDTNLAYPWSNLSIISCLSYVSFGI